MLIIKGIIVEYIDQEIIIRVKTFLAMYVEKNSVATIPRKFRIISALILQTVRHTPKSSGV